MTTDAEHLLSSPEPDPALCPLADLERTHIDRVLHAVAGHQRRAAEVLGISRWALARRMRRYGLASRDT